MLVAEVQKSRKGHVVESKEKQVSKEQKNSLSAGNRKALLLAEVMPWEDAL